MVRNTTQHGWEVPESGDSARIAAAAIDDLLDEIDRVTPIRGHETTRPAAGERGRVFIDTTEDPPTIYWDRGDRWLAVAGDYNIPSNLARTDQQIRVQESWEFDEPVDGDILGNAATADDAEFAEQAEEAKDLVDVNVDDLLRTDDVETFEQRMTFEETADFESGARVEGGTIDLPVYDGSDPPLSEREAGSMWFREDHQPAL
ncbi:MAG: hypothetical protein ACOCSN_05475 [Halanaeroarchaeum sp.]